VTSVTVLYFASLRDAAGSDRETNADAAADLRALYVQLRTRHSFVHAADRLRVALDGSFARCPDGLRAGSEVAFIPPVSPG